MTVTIYHNPRCATSRKALQLLESRGAKPRVVDYLKTPPTAKELKRILRLLRLGPRQLLRRKEAKAAGLDKPGLSDEALIEAMLANPIVIERPIVVAGAKAALGRPPEKVLEVL